MPKGLNPTGSLCRGDCLRAGSSWAEQEVDTDPVWVREEEGKVPEPILPGSTAVEQFPLETVLRTEHSGHSAQQLL